MAKIFLTSSAKLQSPKEWDLGAYKALKASAQHCTEHTLVEDPESADLIVFAELGTTSGPFDEFIRSDPLYKKYRSKVYVFMNRDYSFHAIPGLYTGLDKNLHFPWAQAGFYIIQNPNPFLNALEWNAEAPYLFSFVGAAINHPVRQRLAAIQNSRGYYQDTGRRYVEATSQGKKEALNQLYHNFAKVCYNSKFILCPRGLTSSSIRLFEAMQAGRVPVIISDDWVAPKGPDWNSFSLRIQEKDINTICYVLSAKEHEAPAMGQKARLAWQHYYAKEKIFSTVINSYLDIRSQQDRWLYRLSRHLTALQLLRPKLAKAYIRTRWTLLRQRGQWYF